MKRIDAFWEKENIGVNCVEYSIDANEPIDDEIINEITNNKTEYQVAKVECGNTDALLFLEKNGFKFIEANIQLGYTLKGEPTIPPLFSRFSKELIFRKATKEETEFILNTIESGTVYTTDKIARDPYFGTKKSGRRYALWSRLYLERGSYFRVAAYRDEIVAFSIGVIKDGYYDAFLGGLIDKKYRSFGFAPVLSTLICAYENNMTNIKTGVSSNNLPILKLHLLFGFEIKNVYYTLIKHI